MVFKQVNRIAILGRRSAFLEELVRGERMPDRAVDMP
nr:MAG TPA: hypothetical protein [Caudoviricetes sp.]